MIKTLRKKFIFIAMCSIAVVFFGIVGIINAVNYYQLNKNGEEILSMISKNGGYFPDFGYHRRERTPGISPEAPFTTRYFTVVLDSRGTVLAVNTGKIAAISTKNASDYAAELFQKGKTKGYLKNYKYERIPYGTDNMYIFLDCEREIGTFYSFLWASLIVSLLGMLLVFLLLVVFSGRAVKPIAESYEKQKRFITDASHEIKTPLAIISANTEVLELESGESEWTESIKKQIARLTSLTEKMVFLSRMDEEGLVLEMTDFSLSELVRDVAEEFTAVASAQQKTFFREIEGDILIHGNEAMLRQLVSILLDNAMKYSDKQGKIVLSLHRREKKTELLVENTVESVPEEKLDQLFERFYRLDSSRNSETGGYGIGLSAAKAIVTAHKGKISAGSGDGKTIEFLVVL